MTQSLQNSSRHQFLANNTNRVASVGDDSIDADQIIVSEEKSWKNFFSYLGPGFLVSIAYIDPGNFETDLQAGALYKYELLWIILVASLAAFIIQSLAARLGVVTGKHLAEHCRAEYPKLQNIILWLLAELAVVACDIPEVIGTAFALDMLFKIPIWCGVLITGLSTLVLLLLQQYGVRKLEFVIAILVSIMAACFFVELGYAKPKAPEVMKGLFLPSLKGNGAAGLAISLLGAMVMPHNLFLHSALVLSRRIPRSVSGIKEACRYYTMESAFALSVSFLINVSIIAVSGAICSSKNLDPSDKMSCQDLDLDKASFLLKNVLGNWSSKLFAIALLASGQSSTITGTYAGQYVMQGFLDLRITPWIRNMLTRSLAIVPSLIVAVIGGSAGAGELIIVASMILSFVLPFTLVPLLKFTSSKSKMGTHANSSIVSAVTWIISSFVMAINTYYIVSGFIKLLLGSKLKKILKVISGMIGFSGIIVYLVAVVYLVVRKTKYVEQTSNSNDAELGKLQSEPVDDDNLLIYNFPREEIANLQQNRMRVNGD